MVLATTLTVEVDSILSAADSAQLHDLQTALSNLHSLQSMEVTTQLLSETQVGKKIRKLTKHSDAGIAEAAKTVLAKWKECVRHEQEGQSKRPSDCESMSLLATCRLADAVLECCLLHAAALDREDSKSTGSNKRAKTEPNQQVKADKQDANHPSLEELKARLPRLDDPFRHKTAQLMVDGLYKALQEGVEGDAVAVAASIEHAVFLQNGGVTAAYKTKVRSLAFNMKDARNPDLRARVLEGKISGHVLVDLTSDELASDERRKENKEIKEYKLKEANPAGLKKATTDAFQYVLHQCCCACDSHAPLMR